MNTLSEIPKSEGGILATCHQEALCRMAGCPGQLHVMAGQAVHERLTANIPEVCSSIPGRSYNLETLTIKYLEVNMYVH